MEGNKIKLIFLILLIPLFTFAELEVIPNPFNSDSETATIRFTTPNTTDVTIGVYDSNNAIRRRLYAGVVLDELELIWDGKDDYGNFLEEGSYTVKIQKDQYPASNNTFESYVHYGSDAAYYKKNNNTIYIIVSNLFGHQIEIFDAINGSVRWRFGQFGYGDHDLYFPLGTAIDDENEIVYVSDASGKIRRVSLGIMVGLRQLNPFWENLTGEPIRGMDFHGDYLYAANNGNVIKLDRNGTLEASTKLTTWDIPDVCVSDVGANTYVYFLVNYTTGPGGGLYRIDEESKWGEVTPLRIPAGDLTDINDKWQSISLDHNSPYLFLLYRNDTEKKFGIFVINPFGETLQDQFEILEISTTGTSIAAVNSIALDYSWVWVPGYNIINGFSYHALSIGNGTLSAQTMYGNPSTMFLWLGDIEVIPGDYVYAADRGMYPEVTSGGLFGIFDLESLNIFTGVSSINFGDWGITGTDIFEPRGVGCLFNSYEYDLYYYVINRSSTAYPNHGKIIRYESDLDTHIDYFTPRTIENPTGMDAFYTWLLTLENDQANSQSRVIMINAFIDSPAATIPTEFAQSQYRTDLDEPVDVAIDYIGNIYALDKDAGVRFFINSQTWTIDFVNVLTDLNDKVLRDYTAIAVDEFGKIYVYDDITGKILVVNKEGELLTRLGFGKGSGPGYFNRVEGMDFDSEGNLWISDSGNHRYQKVVFNYGETEQEIVTITDNVGMPYVSTFSLSSEEPVIAGELEITIGFSESMDTSTLPEVLMVDGQFGNTYPLTQISYQGNEWKGTVIINPNTGNGKATVVIRNARDLDGHYILQTERQFRINTKVADLISNLTNYPNPFSPFKGTTRIEYYLNEPSFVTLQIFDLTGRLVREKEFSPGQIGGKEGFENYFNWDGTTDSGVVIQNGVYILKITAKGFASGEKKTIKRKIAVMK